MESQTSIENLWCYFKIEISKFEVEGNLKPLLKFCGSDFKD